MFAHIFQAVSCFFACLPFFKNLKIEKGFLQTGCPLSLDLKSMSNPLQVVGGGIFMIAQKLLHIDPAISSIFFVKFNKYPVSWLWHISVRVVWIFLDMSTVDLNWMSNN